MSNNFSKNKVVVITGGAKKIGRATAKKLADQGFNILIHTGGKSIDEAKKNFKERLNKINWENQINDYPFNPSALSLFKWAPIADELKDLDRKIVLNSMILKWDIIKQEFKDLIKF